MLDTRIIIRECLTEPIAFGSDYAKKEVHACTHNKIDGHLDPLTLDIEFLDLPLVRHALYHLAMQLFCDF